MWAWLLNIQGVVRDGAESPGCLNEPVVLGRIGLEFRLGGIDTLGLDHDPKFPGACSMPAAAWVLAADSKDEVRVGASLASPPVPTLLVFGQGPDPHPTHCLNGIAVPVAALAIRAAHGAGG